ncbi:MAG: FHA domain-containing protein [Anaerolineae bacterium]|nr:FHA domain-containing protein [Anaerolineae bacterium]
MPAVVPSQQAPAATHGAGVPTVQPVDAVGTAVPTVVEAVRTVTGAAVEIAEAAGVEALICGQCGASLQPGSAFCDMCGAPVTRGAVRSPNEVQTQITTVGTASAAGVVATAEPVEPVADWAPFQPGRTVMVGAPAWEPATAPWAAPVVTGRLVVQATGALLPLPPGKLELLIGREDPISGIYPDVDLTDHGGDEGGVSRKHARLAVQGGQFAIEDLGSVNGTFVNGVRLAFGEKCLLSNSDQIKIGRVLLVLQVS